MTIVEDLLKVIQATIAPELNAIKERIDANHRETLLLFAKLEGEMTLRFERFEERIDAAQAAVMLRFDGVNQRFDDLNQKLALDRRVETIERELDEKRKAS